MSDLELHAGYQAAVESATSALQLEPASVKARGSMLSQSKALRGLDLCAS